MNYAKLRTLKLTNFMSIADAEIPISAITNICGYNDQGKSAIRTALSVVMYDSDSNDQVKFIKDGTEFFEISCTFEDGVTISKTKKLNGASVWVMKKGEQVAYTNVQGDKVIAVEDVPEPIAQYWGVYADEATGQLLNVRTDRDPHFLTDNSGGENYKILSPLLHSDVLAKASAEIIKDSNVCKNEIDDQTTRYNMYTEMIESKVTPTEEMLNTLQTAINATIKKKDKQELITNILNADNIVRTTDITPEVSCVDITKLQLAEQLSITEQATKDCVYDEVTVVDLSKLQLLETMLEASNKSIATESTPEVNTVSTAKLDSLVNLMTAVESVAVLETELQALNEQITVNEQELNSAKQAMSDAGYRICKNCGSLVE